MEGVSLDKPADDSNGDGTGEAADGNQPTEVNGTTEQFDGEPKGDEMDFSKDKEFEILGKLSEDWRDHMASVGGTQSGGADARSQARPSAGRASRRSLMGSASVGQRSLEPTLPSWEALVEQH